MNVSNIYFLSLDFKKAEELRIKFTENKKSTLYAGRHVEQKRGSPLSKRPRELICG
jgi:hypothetical protein